MLVKNLRFYFLVLSFFTYHSLSAWWDAGHLAVAQIGYEELRPDVKKQVDAYLEAVSGPFPQYSDFIMAAIWADDIVHEGIQAFGEWHRSSRPYDPHGVLSPSEYERLCLKIEDHDCVWAITECLKTLENRNASPWAKGFMLRMLIHIVGDIHQPCHCITYYSPDFPNGDRGGTRFKIKDDAYGSLHSLTDAAFGLGNRRPERPMNQEDKRYLDNLVTHLKENFPREMFDQLADKTIDSWREESYNIGVDFVYAYILPNEDVSEEVMEEGKIVAGKQLALAGYRLGNLLNDLIGASHSLQEVNCFSAS